MKILHSWLNEFADFGNDVDAIADRITELGLAVESVDRVGTPVKGVVMALNDTCGAAQPTCRQATSSR